MTFKTINIGKYTPIVIDCETSGCDPQSHAILEIALVTLKFDGTKLLPDYSETFHLLPFEGAEFDPQSMAIHQIDPFQPLRFAITQDQAMQIIKTKIEENYKKFKGQRAILVGHNAWFDLAFINAAYERCNIKSPFHRFTSCDTATLSGFIYNETVLAKALYRAKISYNPQEAHGALYDAQKTAELYCRMINNKKRTVLD